MVALTHYLTKDQIHHQEQAQLLSVLNQVIPHNMHDNSLYESCTLVSDPSLGTKESLPVYMATLNGQPSALAIEAIAPDGYNGAIKIIVGIEQDGTVSGTRVLSHQETPGLGDKIDLRITNWILVLVANNSHQKTNPHGKYEKMAVSSTSSRARQ